MLTISTSILSSDFSNLKKEIISLEKANTDMIHLDIMDGHFVSNITFGHQLVKSLRKYTKLPFDVHLMIDKPELQIENFFYAGADIITIHYESTINISKTIDYIIKLGMKAGVAISPNTNPEVIDSLITKLDVVLIMTVYPGRGGQKFLTDQLDKVKIISKKISLSQKDIKISLDGGINDSNIKQCLISGADIVVVGSYIFSQKNYKNQIYKLKNIK